MSVSAKHDSMEQVKLKPETSTLIDEYQQAAELPPSRVAIVNEAVRRFCTKIVSKTTTKPK